MALRRPLILDGETFRGMSAAAGDTVDPALVLPPAPVYARTDLLYNPRSAPMASGSNTISGRGYFTYLGKLTDPFVANYVRFASSSAGAGAQTAEVAVYSSASAPVPGVGATLTLLAASTALDSLTSTGAKKNTTALGLNLAAGTHVWVGLRVAMVTTQPALGRAQDPLLGECQSGSSAALDTVPIQSAIGIQGLTTVHPYLTLWT